MVSAARYGMTVAPQTLSSFTPVTCATIGMAGPGGVAITPEAVERRVTDFLFLLLDDSGPSPTCGAASSSPAYRLRATPIWEKNAKLIMSIFDNDLDFSQPDPVNVTTFARAWLARGGNRAHLGAAMTAVGMTPLPVMPPQPPVSPPCRLRHGLQPATGRLHGRCAQRSRARRLFRGRQGLQGDVPTLKRRPASAAQISPTHDFDFQLTVMAGRCALDHPLPMRAAHRSFKRPRANPRRRSAATAPTAAPAHAERPGRPGGRRSATFGSRGMRGGIRAACS